MFNTHYDIHVKCYSVHFSYPTSLHKSAEGETLLNVLECMKVVNDVCGLSGLLLLITYELETKAISVEA